MWMFRSNGIAHQAFIKSMGFTSALNIKFQVDLYGEYFDFMISTIAVAGVIVGGSCNCW